MYALFLLLLDALMRPLILWPFARVGHAVSEFWRLHHSEDWYQTSGTVFRVRAKQKGRLWRVWVGYHYLAEARHYHGIWSRIFVFEREVDNFLQRYRNAPIMVRYSPGQVSRSLILDGDQRTQLATSEKAQAKRASN